MGTYEYTGSQVWWDSARVSWKPPVSDVPSTRRVDRTEVTSTTADHPMLVELGDDPVRMPESPSPWRGQHSLPGRPVMRASDRMVTFHENHWGKHTAKPVPLPAAPGGYWVEDMPWPWVRMAWSDFYDKHIIMVHEDGRTWEMIGATRVFGFVPWGVHYRCLHLARYSSEGVITPGDKGVIASQNELSTLLLNRFDDPHRLTITLRGSDKNPEQFKRIGTWVALDPAKAPTGLRDQSAQKIVNMLVTHGALITDHGGVTNLSHVSGAQWNDIDFGGWQPRMTDFLVAS